MQVDKLMETLVNLGTTWGVRVVGVIVALIAGRIVAGWAGRSLARTLQQRKFDETLARFFSNLLRYAILLMVVIGCLGVFGIQTASFAAVLAAAGLAIGLALQGTLGNFAAGVMLLVFRPFKVGDVVKVAGELGVVKNLELFTTELTTPDNRKLIIPNGAIFGKTIENITAHDTRRVDVTVGVTYDESVERVREVLEGCIAEARGALTDPAPQVFLKELGASSVDWQLRVWCKTADYWTVHQDLIRIAKRTLDDAKIGIPYPQVDVHFDHPALRALSNGRSAAA